MEEIIKKLKLDYNYTFTGSNTLWDERYIACDPLFWTSLGKVCGWNDKEATPNGDGRVKGSKHKGETDRGSEQSDWISTWLYHSLQFHEINLTEGWTTAVNYLTQLVK